VIKVIEMKFFSPDISAKFTVFVDVITGFSISETVYEVISNTKKKD
jgi:hypothetical protein